MSDLLPDAVQAEEAPQADPFAGDVQEMMGGEDFNAAYERAKARSEEAAKAAQEAEGKPEGEAAKTEESEAAKPEGEKEAEAPQEEGITIDRVKELLGERDLEAAIKAFDNREQWERTLKQRSQAIAFLEKIDPEKFDLIVPQILPYAYSQKKLPEAPADLVDEVMKDLSIPSLKKQIKLEDWGNEAVEAAFSEEELAPHIKSTVKQVLNKVFPELPVLRERVRELSEQHKQSDDYVKYLENQNGELILSTFLAGHNDMVPQKVNEAESDIEALVRVGESGEDHPEYWKYIRIKAAADLRADKLKEGKNLSYEQAYKLLYGASDAKAKRAEEITTKIVNGQKEPQQEPPGERVPPKRESLMPKSHAQQVEEILRKQGL